MCYYNHVKMTREGKMLLKRLEKLVANYKFIGDRMYTGLEYPQAPVLQRIPDQTDFEIVEKEWGLLPTNITSVERVSDFRIKAMTLNARSENLFVNEQGRPAMFADAAMNRRCLIPSTGFYEWRHVKQRGKNGKVLKQTIAFPYIIKTSESNPFYFAGIWNPGKVNGDTFSIVTTEANDLMQQIHNTAKRMPTILTEDLAWEWMFNSALSKTDVQDIARSQYDAAKLTCYTVDKGFRTAPDPTVPVHYSELPPLGDDIMGTPQLALF